MASLLQLVNEQFTKWVEEENRQLRIIEEAAASLVAAAKTHPARKPHLKRLRIAQKNLETASEQCILYTKLADYISSDSNLSELPLEGDFIEQLQALELNKNLPGIINQLTLLD